MGGNSAACFPSEEKLYACLLYTSDAADERSSVDLGGRRIIKKKNTEDDGSSRVSKKHDKLSVRMTTKTEAKRSRENE